MVCPACMSAFVAPYVGAAPSGGSASPVTTRWDVDDGGADAGPVWSNASRHRVRAALYDGSLGAGARVRPAGVGATDAWALVGSVPEFAVVLGLLGGDLAPLAGARKLAQVADPGGARRRDRVAGLAGRASGGDTGATADVLENASESGGGGGPAPLRNASPGAVGAVASTRSARSGPQGALPASRQGTDGVRASAEQARTEGTGRVNIPTLRANVPTTRLSARTAFLLVLGALAVGMAAWLASG